MLGFDHKGSNNAEESSPNKELNGSSVDFSANKPSTSKKMAQNVVFHVHVAPGEVFEQGHTSDQKISTLQTQSYHN